MTETLAHRYSSFRPCALDKSSFSLEKVKPFGGGGGGGGGGGAVLPQLPAEEKHETVMLSQTSTVQAAGFYIWTAAVSRQPSLTELMLVL